MTTGPTSVGPKPTIYAIDFGTSNSLLAAAGPSGIFPPVPLDPSALEPTILRSILFFSDSSGWSFGAEALTEYVAQGMRGRFLRSIKRFLPVETFVDTLIGGKRVRLEELVGVFLREMRARANRHFDTDVRRVLLGRPARFSDDARLDELAQERLERAARFAGFEDVSFCPEPVAAAYDFRREAQQATTILVADLGGGTSDFTVARLGANDSLEVLAVGGVAVAGDVLDGVIMRHTVAHHFGADVTYKVPFGSNVLTMPRVLVDQLCSPADSCLLARKDVVGFLRDVRSSALGEDDQQHLDQLLCVIEDALGFRVFETIEGTKRALSEADTAPFVFEYPGVDIDESVERATFEMRALPFVDRIMSRLEDTLSASGLAPDAIDVVCATGGTARVPLLARRLDALFGREKRRELGSFHAVTRGLSERALRLVRE